MCKPAFGSGKEYALRHILEKHGEDPDKYPIIIADPILELQETDVDMAESQKMRQSL